jgi:superfamily II DNA helicase RecQ
VVLSPEVLISEEFRAVLESREWKKRLKHVRVDEAHCIETWASFRAEFRQFEFLRDQFPSANFFFTTATLTTQQTNHLQVLYKLPYPDTKVIRLSNKRRNVQIVLLTMQHPANSFQDLLRFICPVPSLANPCQPFIVYVNSIEHAEGAATFLCAVLKTIDPSLEDKVTYVHSLNSKEHLSNVIKGLTDGTYWGVIATEILGMVSRSFHL